MTNKQIWSDTAFDFSGASVLVTGGTAGIGASIAAAYVKAGATVTITGTRPSAQDYDEDLSPYRYQQLQLDNHEHIEALAAALPELDILVNNAGEGAAFEEYKPDVFDHIVNILLNAAYRLSSALYEQLEKSQRPGGGAIINISSSSSRFAVDAAPAYGAAKAGLNGLTRNLATAWGKNNIRVNAIAPGLTRTRMTAPMWEMETDEYLKPAVARTPLQRLAEADEMAGAVLFLSSSAAGFITGQVLSVDGGFSVTG